ncbi:MAG TPA: hypothetical protein VHL59_18995 [Thermoanaerobaculia bacterium]|nr:hypothetical protein [Thermoanaerobaculia bacterium]
MSSQSYGRTVILEHFAHLDWDWTSRFTQYLDQTRPIYSAANELLQTSDDPNYTYSTCEIAFLRDYAENFPTQFEQMVATGRLVVVGGAITSPDNLLTAGECFFRTFLVGVQWMAGYSLEWNGMVWLPDDFGHDSQLPATLVAMGAGGVGFARVPGDITGPNLTTARPQPVAAPLLNQAADGNGGIDFWWQASDGSTIFAHWMPRAYWQGSNMTSSACIDTYLAQNGPASPSRYVHVPVGGDFMTPKAQLPTWVAEWKGGPEDAAMVRSFAEYVLAVKNELNVGLPALKTRTFHGASPTTSFLSNPYFLGFYASRMELKTLHNATTRLLLQAEVLDAACAALGGPRDPDVVQRLLNAWNDLAPSTHHDYITGTAIDDVYTNEQLPRLQQVHNDAESLLSTIVDTIVTNVPAGDNILVAFNTLAFTRTGMVRLPGGGDPVWLTVPAMGWIAPDSVPPIPHPVTFGVMTNDHVQMSNGIVSVTISRDANWGISSFGSAASAESILDGVGNVLSVWEDGGNIYTFGYECSDPSFSPAPTKQTAQGAPLCERAGDLYAAVTVSLTLNVDGTDYPYTLRYSLTAGDPFVSISITGAAPSGHTSTSSSTGTSVFVHFPFKGGPLDRMEHGTPNHWDWKEPATLGTGAYQRVFEPTHNFVTAWAGGSALGAIYHGGVPAWALDGSTLTGCILRNTPDQGCASYYATGSDRDVHTITFALRIGDGVEHAESGKVLREALSYNNPLFCAAAAAGASTLERTASLASSDTALITVAKRGTANPDELYLRVYNPANSAQTVDLTVSAPFSSAAGATALERPLANADEAALAVQVPAPGAIRFTANHALTTLRLT